PKDKRLPMMVEDHPYDYKDFKGVIPADNYGAGIVDRWAKGNHVPVNKVAEPIFEKQLLKDIRSGSIKFKLKGRKLKGEFALVRMKVSDTPNAWLMIKHRDEAVVEGYDSEEHVAKNSPINKALAAMKTARKKTSSKGVKR